MRLFKRLKSILLTGYDEEVFNNGKPIKGEYVIRFKDYYISVLEGDNELSLSWSKDPMMMSNVPLREHLVTIKVKDES